jgi:hypothetical protein
VIFSWRETGTTSVAGAASSKASEEDITDPMIVIFSGHVGTVCV